jgi:hypothetical protein
MPCFQPDQAFTEGVVLGRILAGYGELELTMCECVIETKRLMNENILDLPIRDIFGKRGAEQRIKIAKKSLLAEYTKANLQTELVETLKDMEWCRLIRNQYAHCHWYWTQQEGLCFVNLEELAEQPSEILELMSNRHPIDVPLLYAQESFLNYVKESFTHLASAYRAWNQRRSALRPSIHVFEKPSKLARPLLHN